MGMETTTAYTQWQFDPALIGGLWTLALCYTLAVGPLRRYIAAGKPFPKARAACFYGAIVAFYLTEGSPLHDWAEVYLLSAHMLQHMLLSFLVAPLFIWGMPAWLLKPLLLNRLMAPISRVLCNVVVAFVMFNLFFSLWHLPIVYEAALRDSFIHHSQHLIFLTVSLMMWWPILSPLPERPRLSYAGQFLYLFLQPIAQLFVFGIITYAGEAIYPTYLHAPRVTLFDPVVDQSVAGALMKVGGMLVYGLAMIIIFFRWYQEEYGGWEGRRRPATPPPEASSQA